MCPHKKIEVIIQKKSGFSIKIDAWAEIEPQAYM